MLAVGRDRDDKDDIEEMIAIEIAIEIEVGTDP